MCIKDIIALSVTCGECKESTLNAFKSMTTKQLTEFAQSLAEEISAYKEIGKWLDEWPSYSISKKRITLRDKFEWHISHLTTSQRLIEEAPYQGDGRKNNKISKQGYYSAKVRKLI